MRSGCLRRTRWRWHVQVVVSGGGKRRGTVPGSGGVMTDLRLHVRGTERADGLEVEIKPSRTFTLGVLVISTAGAAILLFI